MTWKILWTNVLVKLINITVTISAVNLYTMNHLEVKHLRMIQAIARSGNMTKAADRLFLSQSALSQQLKDIESKLGLDIFFRTSRKMILTATGNRLLETAKQIIDILDDAELEIAKIVSGDTGEFKVGTRCIFCYKWLPRVMGIFLEKFPNIDFEIGNSNDPVQELETKQYDLIITAGSTPNDTYTYSQLFKDQLVCILPPDHSLSTKPFLQLKDFQNLDLISHTEKAGNKFYQMLLNPNGIEPRRLMTVGQPQAIFEMVASGFGVGIFPQWAIKTQLSQARVIALPITQKGLPLSWYAVSLRNTSMPIFYQEFINIVSKINITSSS